jgi:trehalose 6-phosphate phosphatase
VTVRTQLKLREKEILFENETPDSEHERPGLFAVAPPPDGVPHLLDGGQASWEPVARQIKNAKSIWIFLDFDGTLVKYYDRPEDVKLSRESREVLLRLSRNPRVHLAIVSGRRNAALREHFPKRSVKLLGLFGWEVSGRQSLSPRIKASLRRVRPVLAELPKLFPGIFVENKGISYAVHFRGLPVHTQRRVRSRVRKVVARMGRDFGIIESNHASEIVPRQVRGKGVAIREFIRSLPSPFLPIYVGDDLTDEPAFAVLRRGITVRVGDLSRTKARFGLKSPEEVCKFLERVEEDLS